MSIFRTPFVSTILQAIPSISGEEGSGNDVGGKAVVSTPEPGIIGWLEFAMPNLTSVARSNLFWKIKIDRLFFAKIFNATTIINFVTQ